MPLSANLLDQFKPRPLKAKPARASYLRQVIQQFSAGGCAAGWGGRVLLLELAPGITALPQIPRFSPTGRGGPFQQEGPPPKLQKSTMAPKSDAGSAW
jgi:hypothetical protein